VIQGLRQPGSKPMQVGGAGGGVGKGSIHGPCSGRHFSIVPADSLANRYLHPLTPGSPQVSPPEARRQRPAASCLQSPWNRRARRSNQGWIPPGCPAERLPLRPCCGRGGPNNSHPKQHAASQTGSRPRTPDSVATPSVPPWRAWSCPGTSANGSAGWLLRRPQRRRRRCWALRLYFSVGVSW
jgi:hypothetical protein